MTLGEEIKQLITEFGVPVTVTKADGSGSAKTVGAYAAKTIKSTTDNGVQLTSSKQVYVAPTKSAPEPNDVVVIGKTQSRIIDVLEYSMKGVVIAYMLTVQ